MQAALRFPTTLSRKRLALCLAGVLSVLIGVSTAHAQAPSQIQGQSQSTTANPKDPFESFNRSVFEFNDRLDQSITKPIAQTYVKVTPDLVQTGVRNFFGNLSDMWSLSLIHI